MNTIMDFLMFNKPHYMHTDCITTYFYTYISLNSLHPSFSWVTIYQLESNSTNLPLLSASSDESSPAYENHWGCESGDD